MGRGVGFADIKWEKLGSQLSHCSDFILPKAFGSPKAEVNPIVRCISFSYKHLRAEVDSPLHCHVEILRGMHLLKAPVVFRNQLTRRKVRRHGQGERHTMRTDSSADTN